MRLATFFDGTTRRIGAIQDDALIDLSAFAHDMLSLIDGGVPLITRIRDMVTETSNGHAPSSAVTIPLHQVTLLAPIPRPRKNIVCLGRNYAEHVAETARAHGRTAKIPDHPVFFTKAITAVNHPGGIIPYDATISTEIDWEVELACIIGQKGKNIAHDAAMEYIFGYTILNDITARDLQNRHRQFYKGKSLDGCAPIGPWIVTAEEIPDPHALGLRLRVNGETMQDGNTSAMVYKIPELVATLSQGMTLEPGDIIATGTPAGVGMAMEPPRFLRPGDSIEAEIDGIGVLSNRIERAS